MASTQSQIQNQINTQYAQNNGLAPGFGNTAAWYTQNNPASYMVDPNWYYNNQQASMSGIAGAQNQQAALGQNADTYDANANKFDDFANGVGAQLAPGLAQQQGQVNQQQGMVNQQQTAANKQQSQADALWANPGYNDQEKQAMQTSAQTPIAGSYTAAQGDLQNQAARTGNSAAYGAQAADLARKKASDMSMAGLGMQGQFANQRIAGQQFANQAQGAAGQAQGAVGAAQGAVGAAQGAVNQNNQSGQSLQNNIYNTGAGIRQGGANIRTAAAGSNLQTAQTAQQGQQVQQGAGALSMAPGNLAATMYGTTQGSLNNTLGQQNQMNANNPSFLKQLGSGLAGSLGNLSGTIGKVTV